MGLQPIFLVIRMQERFFSRRLLFIVTMFLWKNDKSFLILISLEILALIILIFIMLSGASLVSILITLFVFFVRESLIILTVIYNSIRLAGGVYGELGFF